MKSYSTNILPVFSQFLWNLKFIFLGSCNNIVLYLPTLTSQIIEETPEFELYLPDSRLGSDIFRIIAKDVISCRLDFPIIKFEIFCVVWAAVNMERFL